MCSFNLRLLKDGKDFHQIENARAAFRLELLDNNKVVVSKKGWNQMNCTHLLLKAN